MLINSLNNRETVFLLSSFGEYFNSQFFSIEVIDVNLEESFQFYNNKSMKSVSKVACKLEQQQLYDIF